MSTITAGAHSHDDAHGHTHAHAPSFIRKYVFSLDHKIIGIQFLFSTLLWFLVGGLLALAVRWQVAWPWSDMPVIGKLLIPLMIGADDMAFPTLNMLSYWFMWPAFISIGLSFFVSGGAAKAGWTSYPPLSLTDVSGQTLWLIGVTFVGISSMMGSINYMTTIIQMRAPGMTM